MYYIAVYGWSQYTTPAGLPQDDLLYDSHANHPDSPDYDENSSVWTGQPFTYNGGGSTLLPIDDDDGDFEDAYVETGGAQTLGQDVVINGVTYPAGSVVQNEFSMIDASGNEVWVVRIGDQNVGFAYPAGQDPSPGDTFTGEEGRDGAADDSSDGSASTVAYSGVICFSAETPILTPDGPRRAAALRPGDLVMTADLGPKTVVWAGYRTYRDTRLTLARRPVLVGAGAGDLGGLARLARDRWPLADLVVSPHHRLLLDGRAVAQISGHQSVLAPAKGLLALPGVRRMMGLRAVTYVHILLETHGILFSAGRAAESLYPGPQAISGLSPGARATVGRLLGSEGADRHPGFAPARPCLTVTQTRALVERAMDLRGGLRGACPGARERRAIAARPA